MNIHRPTYWAKIFVPVIEILIFLPTILTFIKYYHGCSIISEKSLGAVFIAIWLLVWLANFFYYSASKIRKISTKYSKTPRLKGNIKLFSIVVFLLCIFFFLDDLLKLYIDIPQC